MLTIGNNEKNDLVHVETLALLNILPLFYTLKIEKLTIYNLV